MSVGNLKDNGNKGNNFPYQLNTLKTLGLIAGSTAAGATEATLLQVLAAIQSGQEYEQNLVVDQRGVGCPGNCPTYLQVRIWNTATHTFDPPIYYDAAGTLVVPVGPLQLVNPQYVLDNILTQVTATASALNVNLSTIASQATVASILTTLNNIKLDTANLASVNRTPGFSADTVSVGATATPTGVVAFSLLFRGIGGTLNGRAVPDGYTVNYGNGKDPITVSMNYVRPTGGTGMEVLISTLT